MYCCPHNWNKQLMFYNIIVFELLGLCSINNQTSTSQSSLLHEDSTILASKFFLQECLFAIFSYLIQCLCRGIWRHSRECGRGWGQYGIIFELNTELWFNPWGGFFWIDWAIDLGFRIKHCHVKKKKQVYLYWNCQSSLSFFCYISSRLLLYLV